MISSSRLHEKFSPILPNSLTLLNKEDPSMIRFLKACVMTFLLSVPLTVNAVAPSNDAAEQPQGPPACVKAISANMLISPSNSLYSVWDGNRGFEGCWSYFPQGPCRAIYRDNNGNYTICGQCDSFGNPGSGRCSRISSQTLNIGYWCS